MADSEKPQVATPPETALVVIKTKEGGTREMIRASSGQFVRKPKPPAPVVDFTRKDRKFLNSPNKKNPGLTEHEVAFRNVMRIAQGEGSGDPKADMAAVKAYEVAMRRALGKEDPSEKEMDKLTTQPVKTIIVVSPDIMNPKIVDADNIVEKAKQPSFAEVVSVTTNEKK